VWYLDKTNSLATVYGQDRKPGQGAAVSASVRSKPSIKIRSSYEGLVQPRSLFIGSCGNRCRSDHVPEGWSWLDDSHTLRPIRRERTIAVYSRNSRQWLAESLVRIIIMVVYRVLDCSVGLRAWSLREATWSANYSALN